MGHCQRSRSDRVLLGPDPCPHPHLHPIPIPIPNTAKGGGHCVAMLRSSNRAML